MKAMMVTSKLKLSDHQKAQLASAVEFAYNQGWDGTDNGYWPTLRAEGWTRSAKYRKITIPTFEALERLGALNRQGDRLIGRLTQSAIQVGIETYEGWHREHPRVVAERERKKKQDAEALKKAEVAKAKQLFKGFKIKDRRGKRVAVSSLIDQAGLEHLTLDAVLMLGEQIHAGPGKTPAARTRTKRKS